MHFVLSVQFDSAQLNLEMHRNLHLFTETTFAFSWGHKKSSQIIYKNFGFLIILIMLVQYISS